MHQRTQPPTQIAHANGLSTVETGEAFAAAATEAADAYAHEACMTWCGWNEADPAERDEILRGLSASLRWLALASGINPGRLDTDAWTDEIAAAVAEIEGRAEAAYWPTDTTGAPEPVAGPRTAAWTLLLVDSDWPGADAVDTAWSEDSVQHLAGAAAAAEAEAMNALLAQATTEPYGPRMPWWDSQRAQIIAPFTRAGAAPLPTGTADLLSQATDTVLARLSDLHIEVATAAIGDLATDAAARGVQISILDDDVALDCARRGEHLLRYWASDTGPHYALSPSMRSVEELRHLLAQHPGPDETARAAASAAAGVTGGVVLRRWAPVVGVEG